MPGISFKCDLHPNNRKKDGNSDDVFLKALDSTVYNDSYREVLLRQDSYLLASTKYRDYPIKIFEDNEFWICVEGMIYGKANHTLAREMHDLMYHIFYCNLHLKEGKKIIENWLLQTDGDFVIFALDKMNKNVTIINDVLGRLPLYYYHPNDTELIVSREIQFISTYLVEDNNNNSANKFDLMGIAQMLLFCHTLGKRTLLSDVFRLEPASMIKINKCNSKIQIENLYRFNFEDQLYATDDIKKNAEKLVSLFCSACKNRVSRNTKNIISLSGGLDSRAVAACFHKEGILGYAATLVDPAWAPAAGNSSEEEVASQIAELFGIEWQNCGLIQPSGKDVLMLLKIKNGLTYLAFSLVLPFLKRIKDKHSPSSITLFTGHGGGIIFSDLTPKKKIVSIDELVCRITRGRGFFSLSEVAALTKTKEAEIVNELKDLLASYPENDLNRKYTHYLFYEIDFKFGFESEDINRYFFWSVSPFYAVPFFYYAVNCDTKHKSQQKLYREFLKIISPSAAAIATSNWGCSILSNKYKIMQFILSLTFRYRVLKRIIKRVKSNGERYTDNSRVIRCINHQADSCTAISNYLSHPVIKKILTNPSDYSHVGIDNLFTVASLIEKEHCDSVSIEKYDEY